MKHAFKGGAILQRVVDTETLDVVDTETEIFALFASLESSVADCDALPSNLVDTGVSGVVDAETANVFDTETEPFLFLAPPESHKANWFLSETIAVWLKPPLPLLTAVADRPGRSDSAQASGYATLVPLRLPRSHRARPPAVAVNRRTPLDSTRNHPR